MLKNNLFINIYILLPFVFSFLLGIFTFIKNPIHIKRITKILFFIIFLCTFFILICYNNLAFSIFKIKFYLSNFSSIIIFINAFIFLIFSIISKTFIQKSQKLFSCATLLTFGLINIITLNNNIIATLGGVFWLLLIYFLLDSNYDRKNQKKFFLLLQSDIFLLLLCSILIFYDFARLFILNEISFDFVNIKENLNHINNIAILSAFFGLNLIIARLFNFLPFGKKLICSNPLIETQKTLTSFIVGNIILYKTFITFDYLFYDFEKYITIYLIINFIWFTFLSCRQDNLIKIINSILPVYSIINIFTIFSFEQKGIYTFIYGVVSILASFLLIFIVFSILTNKFKSDKIEDLQKISPKNRILKFFIIISILNLAKAPPFALFSSNLFSLIMIFSINYNEPVMELMPYILITGTLMISIFILNIFYKILIEPQSIPKNETKLAKHQIIAISLIIIIITLIGICPSIFYQGGF